MGSETYAPLIRIIENAVSVTALTGAGLSSVSGLPHFRGEHNPIWDKYPQDKVFNAEYFSRSPLMFFDFLRDILGNDYQPNTGHRVLRRLEESGKLKAVITQNIDGLHQKAGSKKVYELHGSVYRSSCSSCGKHFSYDEFISKLKTQQVPSCECGGVVRPAVVFYGEMLPKEDLDMSVYYASNSDLMLVIGTSLAVQPAAYMPSYTLNNGGEVILINKGDTYIDDRVFIKFDDIENAFSVMAEYFEVK